MSVLTKLRRIDWQIGIIVVALTVAAIRLILDGNYLEGVITIVIVLGKIAQLQWDRRIGRRVKRGRR